MRLIALRRPRAAARLALALWIAWAVVVWNVAFDHVIVVAGRKYIGAAGRTASMNTVPRRYENMDDWMRPAVRRAFAIASAAGGIVLVSGLLFVRVARPSAQVSSCA